MSQQRSSSKIPSSWVELQQNKLYFAPSRFLPSNDINNNNNNNSAQQQQEPQYYYHSIDNILSYQSLNADFGPVNLGFFVRAFYVIDYQYRSILGSPKTEKHHNRVLVIICSPNCYVVHNAAAVIAAYCVVVLKMNPSEIKSAFTLAHTQNGLPQFLPFRDASVGFTSFDLTFEDVIDAFHVALRHRWFPTMKTAAENSGQSICNTNNNNNASWRNFDVDSYEEMDDARNADCNVIIPGLFLAMASPVSPSSPANESDPRRQPLQQGKTPLQLLPYLSKNSVRMVIRLSDEPEYSDVEFRRHGIQVEKLSFPDGGIPTDAVTRKFFDACNRIFDQFASGPDEEEEEKTETQIKQERRDALLFKNQKRQKQQAETTNKQQPKPNRKIKGTVAVHCHAGLGRTGTMIALYCMHKYKCTAREIITWLRICRPGSVMGAQQHYLVLSESRILSSHFSDTPPSNLLPKVASRIRRTSAEENSMIKMKRELATNAGGESSSSFSSSSFLNREESQTLSACMFHPRAALHKSDDDDDENDGEGGGKVDESSRGTFFDVGASLSNQNFVVAASVPRLRPQSCATNTTNRCCPTTAAATSRPTTAKTNISITRSNNNNNSLMLLHSSSSSQRFINHSAQNQRPTSAATTSLASKRSLINDKRSTMSSALSLTTSAGCVSAPYSSCKIPWSSPLAPNAVNEKKQVAYNNIAAVFIQLTHDNALASFAAGLTDNGNGSSDEEKVCVLPPKHPQQYTRSYVLRNFGATADSATSLDVVNAKNNNNNNSFDVVDSVEASGLRQILLQNERSKRLFTPIPIL